MKKLFSYETNFGCEGTELSLKLKDKILKYANDNGILSIHKSIFGPSGGCHEYKFVSEKEKLKSFLLKYEFIFEDEEDFEEFVQKFEF